jgi:hypothetical protein
VQTTWQISSNALQEHALPAVQKLQTLVSEVMTLLVEKAEKIAREINKPSPPITRARDSKDRKAGIGPKTKIVSACLLEFGQLLQSIQCQPGIFQSRNSTGDSAKSTDNHKSSHPQKSQKARKLSKL